MSLTGTKASKTTGDKRSKASTVTVVNVKTHKHEYSEAFTTRMSKIGIDLPFRGVAISFSVVGPPDRPVSHVATLLRATMNDGLDVVAMKVDDKDIHTNSVYAYPHYFLRNRLRGIPIKQVAGLRFKIDIHNRSQEYVTYMSSEIKPVGSDSRSRGGEGSEVKIPIADQKDEVDESGMMYGGYRLITLPPGTFLRVDNIVTESGCGRDHISHSYPTCIQYSEVVENQRYDIRTTPVTNVNPQHIVGQACRMLIDMYMGFKQIVSMTEDYKYMSDKYSVKREGSMVIYTWNGVGLIVGGLIAAYGRALDKSPDAWITHDSVHSTQDSIYFTVRHANPKKYMESIIDTVVAVLGDINAKF